MQTWAFPFQILLILSGHQDQFVSIEESGAANDCPILAIDRKFDRKKNIAFTLAAQIDTINKLIPQS